VLVFLNVAVYRLERLYSLIGFILFMVAFGLMIWSVYGSSHIKTPIFRSHMVFSAENLSSLTKGQK
jgi:hypothetical protein